ncbi:MAG TPA: hypothetical protein VJT31_05970, partial [Rugosimonospora sp.]|nr:hypothetical protein [Rugosimonospora sp.]
AVRDSQAPSSRGLAGELSQATGAFTSSTEAPQADPAGQGGTSGRLDVPLYLRRALDEPSSLWNHILRYQLTETQRWLLLVRASFGQSPVYLEALYDATVAFCARHGRTLTTADLDAALAVLNGDLLSVSGGESRRGTMVVEEVDPGVADAIIRFLDIHHDITWRLIETATYFTQVQWLAALLGVVNRPAAALQPSEQIANHAQVKDLMVAAERTLLSDSGVTEGQARVPGLGRPGPFLFFGTRLQLLSRLYAIAGGRPRRSLPDEVIPKLVAEIEEVDDRELLQLLRVLRREMPSFWHSRRTDVEVATLRMLDEPVDADGWDYLREVLNIVPTTGEYEEDLTSKLEAFLEAQVDEARDEIEDGDLGMDKEDLLDELERIANSWDVSADIDGVRDLLIERREAAEPEEKPEPQRESLFDYIVVSADQAEKPATADGSIFDRL